jgi:hypothetical protein
MRGSIHWLAPERHDAGVGFCPDGDLIAGPEDEQLRWAILLGGASSLFGAIAT